VFFKGRENGKKDKTPQGEESKSRMGGMKKEGGKK
jgi:hypothetical protein